MAMGQICERISKGIPMGSLETAWVDTLVPSAHNTFVQHPDVQSLIAHWQNRVNRQEVAGADPQQDRFHPTDSDLNAARDTFARWCAQNAVDHVQTWHHNDTLIPEDLIAQLGELGAFGLTLPEACGGTEMGGVMAAVVSEELSRCWIALGSLATRVDIVGDAIARFGTETQKSRWLPGLIAGTTFGAAVFTEPGTGSDLAALKTRAEHQNGAWVITGQKTWITHGARADLLLVLARTSKDKPRHKGLSLLLVPKTREQGETLFPDTRISGGEIEVLGYRGMKEHEIAFDGHTHPDIEILGEVEDQGFAQLMSVFEGARVQTAARAVGVAQSALEAGWTYAQSRQAFGQVVATFDRGVNKLSAAACDVVMLRALTRWAAEQKDAGHRCDLEAGVAKMLGARVAMMTADAMLQLHGGNGYALEYPISRIWCDARVLGIFEGASEIQADVIARSMEKRFQTQTP